LTGITDIGGSSTLQSLTYGYYPTNNVQTITNAVSSNQNTGSANMSYGYGTGSDLLASLSMGGTVVQTIGYTADGKIASLNPGIQAPAGQYITSLSYNQDGRLASVNAAGGTLASYTYDGFEQRLIKTVSGSWGKIYQYGRDGALLEETNASGVAQADYIYLNRRPVAVLNGSTLYYLHDDMLGTPQLATDGNQAVQWQASYDAFGQASVSGTITQNLRLPGQYFDLETGWNHNGFRDYLPALGRYAEPDPLGRLGSGNNLYLYAYDNPANLFDPLGLCPQKNKAECTALQKAAAELAEALENVSDSAGWTAFGAGVMTVLSGVGEVPSAGLDTPATVTSVAVATFFGNAAYITGALAATLQSYSTGNSDALWQFDEGQAINLSSAAVTSGIPFLKPWAERIGDLAEKAADLAAKAKEEGCE